VILASDDILTLDFVEQTMKFMKKYNPGLVFGSDVIIDKYGKSISKNILYKDKYTKDAGWFLENGIRVPAISGVLMNISKIKKENLRFHPNIKHCPDLYLWLNLGQKFGTFYRSKILIKKRLHGKNESNIGNNKEWIDEYLFIVESFLKEYPYYYQKKIVLHKIYLSLALYFLRHSSKENASKYYLKALNTNIIRNSSPKLLLTYILLKLPVQIIKKIIIIHDWLFLGIPQELSTVR
jgi:hypothetical protein